MRDVWMVLSNQNNISFLKKEKIVLVFIIILVSYILTLIKTGMSWMKIGDSFSEYGFSFEDCMMNSVGSAVAYFISALAEKIDFRVEYTPSFDSIDFFTDYEHLKFLIALKLDGFDFITQEYLKYLELYLGYYTRGYSDQADRERNIYIGIGINLSKIFNGLSMGNISKITKHIQMPYTSLNIEKGQ